MQLQNPSLDTRLLLADKSLFPRESGTKTKRSWLSLLKDVKTGAGGSLLSPCWALRGRGSRVAGEEKKDGQRHIEVR